MNLRAIALGMFAAVLLAVPAAAGSSYRYDATLRCRDPIAEDTAERPNLVKFERTDSGLRLVYRCRQP